MGAISTTLRLPFLLCHPPCSCHTGLIVTRAQHIPAPGPLHFLLGSLPGMNAPPPAVAQLARSCFPGLSSNVSSSQKPPLTTLVLSFPCPRPPDPCPSKVSCCLISLTAPDSETGTHVCLSHVFICQCLLHQSQASPAGSQLHPWCLAQRLAHSRRTDNVNRDE